MPQNRAEELTYYDELGVARESSPDQVREAFRALVRLLHPDSQSDEQLKEMAERQMRKLNRIYEVLSDPDRRRQYDDFLLRRRPSPPPAPPAEEQRNNFGSNRDVSRYIWLGAATLGCALLLWFVADSSASSSPALIENVNASTAGITQTAPSYAAPVADIAQLREDLRMARMERDSALRELAALRRVAVPNSFAPAAAEPRPNEIQVAALPSTQSEIPQNNLSASLPSTPMPAFRPPAARLPTRPFGGFWFFVRTAEDKASPQLYPPEFIEATITEQDGQVRGHYRSRYRIVDRAISPDVNFDFNGVVNGLTKTVNAGWTGPGGARGELTIKLVSEHSVRIEWSADRLGSIQGLTAGTASLTRRLD